MVTVNIKDCKPDQVLLSDAIHHTGKVLLKAGTKITEKHLEIFRAWGLIRVEVEGDDSEVSDTANEKDHDLIEQAKEKLRDRFQHVDLKHPAMEEIFHLAACYFSRKLR